MEELEKKMMADDGHTHWLMCMCTYS